MSRIVIAVYKPKPGKVEQLAALVARHWSALRAESLVTDRAPVVMRAKDGTFIEVFEWRSPVAIEAAHHNPVVQKLWGEFAEACDFVPIAQVAEASEMFSEFAAA
ncbi:MAG: hypothetical protein JNK75_04105 [Betaproteobacteria bacterium]|nr:hypothetical protein [Betaproteobacteria bacterium]